MRLLLIHTAGGESFVALAEDGRVLAQRVLPGRASSESLLPGIRALFAELACSQPEALPADWSPVGSLDGVGVVHGPGSFTGVRVGLSAAKALCEAWALPLVAVSRLALLASAAEPVAEPGAAVLALLDAGRGEVFAGLYRGGVKVLEELLAGSAVAGRFGVGSRAVACESAVMERVGSWVQRVVEPGAEGLLRLVEGRFARGELDVVETVDANYVRRTDAEQLLLRRQAAAAAPEGGP